MFTDKHYQLKSIRLASIESGSRKTADLSVVFLHGWLDNCASFTTVMDQLQNALPQAHLIAVDLPGHGESAHREPGSYYPFHDYIDDLHQLVMQLSPNRLVLVGHSLGALIASCYSAAFPEKVDGLVQIEGFGPLSEDPSNAAKRLRKGVISRERIDSKPDRGFLSLEDMIALRANLNQVAESEIRPIIERGAKQEEERWFWKHDVRLKTDSLYRMSHEHAQNILNSIECPQTVVLASHGFKELAELVAQSKANEAINLHYISGSHHCHLQQPELTSGLIVDLVNKI